MNSVCTVSAGHALLSMDRNHNAYVMIVNVEGVGGDKVTHFIFHLW